MANHTTIEQTRKSLKLQRLMASMTLFFGVGLIIMAANNGEKPDSSPTMINGILTTVGGIAWIIGLRVAKWWHHD